MSCVLAAGCCCGLTALAAVSCLQPAWHNSAPCNADVRSALPQLDTVLMTFQSNAVQAELRVQHKCICAPEHLPLQELRCQLHEAPQTTGCSESVHHAAAFHCCMQRVRMLAAEQLPLLAQLLRWLAVLAVAAGTQKL